MLGLLIGALLGLPGWSAETATHGVLRIVAAATLTALLTTQLSLAASIGRGYLAAVGAMFVMVFSAQVIAALGFGAYFPYSVPGLYAGIAGPDQDPPGPLGFLLVLATATVGVWATVTWWQQADHPH
ncbi:MULTISPECIES: hypothetical protein [unclassified Nonomuraea]|uniref:hypothetical protein n=1 Tax=unclassified Nonomuraea TaxID=2593643 RepID=UPI0033D094B0